MSDLTSIVISWNRPSLLARTIQSLREQSSYPALIVDNGSGFETTDLIRSLTSENERLLLPHNLGINRAVACALELCHTRYVHISDADMQYIQPLSVAVEALDGPAFAVSYQDSPEHKPHGFATSGGRLWTLKRIERGAAMFMRTNYLRSLQPFPSRMTGFDWWVCRYAGAALMRIRQPIWVLPQAAWHLGWRRGVSTRDRAYQHVEWEYHS